jgi:hypothetical protein
MNNNFHSCTFERFKNFVTLISAEQLKCNIHAQILEYMYSLHHNFVVLFSVSCGSTFKGSVQRKLRWVKSNANPWVLASDLGAGHYFAF